MKPQSRAVEWLDHFLCAAAGILALYAAGMGVNKASIATFLALSMTLTSLIGFGLSRWLQPTKFISFDGFLYAGVAIFAIFRAFTLNRLLPDEGFDSKLIYAGVLSWMIILGSLFAWRDQTLLFQAVPSIAIFGLVGAWNTYEGSKVLFFVFLLAIATLFARAHGRSMYRQANITTHATYDELKQGPWRWMAGPEWALGSAASIIVISLFGAPILQESVKGVSGIVRISIPAKPPNLPNMATSYGAQSGTFFVGQGPRQLSEQPIMKVKLDRQRYLRSSTYDVYTGKGWLSANFNRQLTPNKGNRSTAPGSEDRPYNPMKYVADPRIIPVDVTFLFGDHPKLYLPGEPWDLPRDGLALNTFRDGTVGVDRSFIAGTSYHATVIVPPDDAIPKETGVPPNLPKGFLNEFINQENIGSRVRDFALTAAAAGKNELQKALLVQKAIEQTCRYNLDAQAAPSNADPVEYFLFESREGYCDLFASTMALCARSLGMPARLSLGFYPNDNERDGQGYFTVRDSDYHVWCEVYFKDVGWVPFDPTEGATVVGPGRGQGQQRHVPFYQQAWFKNGLDGSLVLLLVCTLAVLFMREGGPREKPSTRRRSQIAKTYLSFEAAIRRATGRPRRFSQTPTEYVNWAMPKLGTSAPEAVELVRHFDMALFAGQELSASQVQELQQKLQSFKVGLKSVRKGRT